MLDLISPSQHKPIAKLAHGLDRVLFKWVTSPLLSPVGLTGSLASFSPGVHWLQDPRSGVYNFTTWLETIPKVKDFAFDRVTGFVQSSSDEVREPAFIIHSHWLTQPSEQDLWTLAKREKLAYTGSTSSLTGMLSHIYFLISGFRGVNTGMLSRSFQYKVGFFYPWSLLNVT